MVLKKLNARSWIYIVGGLFLIIIIALLAYLVFKEKYSAADVPAEPYKCEKECIVLTTMGQDAYNRINPQKPWRVTLRNNSQYTLSINTSPFDIVDSITGKSVYSQPAPTSAITVNEGGNSSWSITTRNINFDDITIPWGRYSIVLSEEIQDPSMYAPSPTIDVYGRYESLEGDDSGEDGDRVMYFIDLSMKEYFHDELSEDGSLVRAINESKENALNTNTPLEIPENIIQKIISSISSKAYAQMGGSECTSEELATLLDEWVRWLENTNSWKYRSSDLYDKKKTSRLCFEKTVVTGVLSGQWFNQYIRTMFEEYVQNEDGYGGHYEDIGERIYYQLEMDYSFSGTMEEHEYVQAWDSPPPYPSGPHCEKKITTKQINKKKTEVFPWKHVPADQEMPGEGSIHPKNTGPSTVLHRTPGCYITNKEINVTKENVDFNHNECCFRNAGGFERSDGY